MERDVSNHPTAAQIASGVPLTDEQLATLTPEQRAVLAPAADAEIEFDGGNDPAPHLLLADADPDESGEELDGDVETDETPGADNGFA